MNKGYSASKKQESDEPECSTYPRSIGRSDGATYFSRRWGNRISGNLKPVKIKWDFDEDDDEEYPENVESHHIAGTLNESTEEHVTEPNNEEDEGHQSYSSMAMTHDSHYEKASLAGSVSKQRPHFMEATYPTSRPKCMGAYSAFSSFAVQVAGNSNEVTPWKSVLSITKGKRVGAEKVSHDIYLLETPRPERSVIKDGTNLCGDSGIGLMATKSLNASNKSSARGLFTPGLPQSVPSESCDVLSDFIQLQSRLPNLNEESSRNVADNVSTPLLVKPKSETNQHVQVEEVSVKSIPMERSDIMELVKNHNLVKKCGRNNSRMENIFNEANKENLSYGLLCDLVSSQGQEKEKEDIRLIRSLSHASIMRDENGKMVTPSKEDRPSSAKSLCNLLHPNQNSAIKVSQHLSRIPTPIRNHTPLKQSNHTSVPITDTAMDTSCVENLHTPMKYSYSPQKDEIHEQKPSVPSCTIPKPCAGVSLGHPNPSLGNNFKSQTDKAPAPLKSVISNPSSNQGSPPVQLQYTMVAPNSRADQGVCFPNCTQLAVHSSGLQPHTTSSTFAPVGMTSNDLVNPGCIFHSAAKSLGPQGSLVEKSSASSVVSNESAPVFTVPSTSRKSFSLRAPSFNLPQSKNDPIFEAKVPVSTLCPPFSSSAAVSQINPNHFQLPNSHSLTNLAAESNTPSHHVVEQKQMPHVQSTKVNYPPVNSKMSDRHNIFSNEQTSVSSLVNTQQTAYDSHAFVWPRGNVASSIQQLNGVDSSNLPLSSKDIGKHLVGHVVVPPTSSVAQKVEESQPVEKISRIPKEAVSQPTGKVISLNRPVSVETNRKILVVNKKKYEVLKLLGKGASSKVYDVLDCQTNRSVAVKRVILKQGDTLVEGYLKEVELLKQLRGSQCIIRLLDSEICLERGCKVLYMVLERGEMDLSTSIKLMSLSGNHPMPDPGHPGGKIPTVAMIYYWVSMLNAVDEIHRKGIVHSDLKPANFLLVGGQVKLIDFGIATAVQVDATSVVKDDPAGTPNYMSPEAIGLTVSSSPNARDRFENPKASYKSDVWSLGCILYSLVYGRSPFQHIMNERMKLDAICNPKYAIPFPSNSVVHPPLLRAMKRCLVRNYKERASIAELKAIDYLCGNDLSEESWNSWKAVATEKILNGLPPECRLQAIKVIQEALHTPPKN